MNISDNLISDEINISTRIQEPDESEYLIYDENVEGKDGLENTLSFFRGILGK